MTDEERCLEIIFHADASRHHALGNMLARQNLAYLKTSQSLLRQRAALLIGLEVPAEDTRRKIDEVLNKEEIICESLWADCLADLQEMVGAQ